MRCICDRNTCSLVINWVGKIDSIRSMWIPNSQILNAQYFEGIPQNVSAVRIVGGPYTWRSFSALYSADHPQNTSAVCIIWGSSPRIKIECRSQYGDEYSQSCRRRWIGFADFLYVQCWEHNSYQNNEFLLVPIRYENKFIHFLVAASGYRARTRKIVDAPYTLYRGYF